MLTFYPYPVNTRVETCHKSGSKESPLFLSRGGSAIDGTRENGPDPSHKTTGTSKKKSIIDHKCRRTNVHHDHIVGVYGHSARR